MSDHDADDISCCNEKSREWFLAKNQDQAQTPDSAIKIACSHDYSHPFILRKINIICSFLEYHKIIEGTMWDEVERLKNSKLVNYKKDIRSLECLSSSAEEETWTLTG